MCCMLRFTRRVLGVAGRLSKPASGDFSKMQQLISDALVTQEPLASADTAFYQGLGFQELGGEYLSRAINAFEIAVKLDPDFRALAEKKMAECYYKLGDYKKACDILSADLQRVALQKISVQEFEILKQKTEEEVSGSLSGNTGQYAMAL